MNIYRISQTVNKGYDAYDSAVVTAQTREQAAGIHPSGEEWRDDTWVQTPDQVVVEHIGFTDRPVGEVICASFNAG